MILRFPEFKRWLPAIICTAAMASVSHAQSMKRGQPILFSAPDNQSVSNATPSLAPKAPDLSALENMIKAPPPGFNFSPPSEPLPVQVITPAQAEQLRQALERTKNWTLMTPAEIMGVETPEKVFGLAETNADQTLAERYVERQASADAVQPTNFFSAPQWNFSSESQMNPDADANSRSRANQPMFSPTFGAPPPTPPESVQNDIWPNPFGVAPPEPKQTPEQLAEAEQFQKLLEPHPATVAAPSANFSTPSPAPGASIPQPPAGVAETLLPNNNVTQPTTVKQAATLSGQKKPASTFEPEWKPQLPPWLSPTPQPGTIPQRQF